MKKLYTNTAVFTPYFLLSASGYSQTLKKTGTESLVLSCSTAVEQVYSPGLEGISHQIDLSSFQKGVYLITIRSKDFVSTRKIIKL